MTPTVVDGEGPAVVGDDEVVGGVPGWGVTGVGLAGTVGEGTPVGAPVVAVTVVVEVTVVDVEARVPPSDEQAPRTTAVKKAAPSQPRRMLIAREMESR